MSLRSSGAFLLAAAANLWGAAPVFSIADYGARNDGAAPATEAIARAIQAAKAAGGGTVYVPTGRYVTGPIELASNLVLYIEAGATLEFPAIRLPFTPSRMQGVECLTPVPLVGGHHLENVTITGRGVLKTDNAEWLKVMPWIKPTANDPGSPFGRNWEHLLELIELRRPVPAEAYEKAAPELRPTFIRLMESRNVLIEGIRVIGSPMWVIDLLYTDNAVVRDVVIESYSGKETDGIGIDSSRNIRISGCYIDTGDDGIVLKSGKDADGLRVNRPTENVSIAHCTVHRAHGAVTIGSETSGGVRNVVAGNITCDGTQMGVRIKSRRGRGGTVENLRFNNWTLENVGQAVNITNYYVFDGETTTAPEPVSERTPVFRNIAISGMTVRGARVAIDIEGLPEMPIDGVRISDFVASARSGMKAYNTTALELHNVQVDAEAGPAFLLRDSKDLELDAVTTRRPIAETPVIRLDHCPSAIVRGGKSAPGTGAYLSVGPGELKSVALQGNALAHAKQAAEESAKEFPIFPEAPTERN